MPRPDQEMRWSTIGVPVHVAVAVKVHHHAPVKVRRATRKYENLKAEPRVALLIDDRRGDMDTAVGSTGRCSKGEVEGHGCW